MRHLTVGILNINQAQLTIDVMEKLALLPKEVWSTQLILVDNGSEAGQLQQLQTWFSGNKERFAEVLFITSSQNYGVNGGRNIILKLTKGDRILILDNDVILPNDTHWLETLWQGMEADPKIGIIGPMLVFAEYPGIVQGAGIGLTNEGRVGYLNRAEPVDSVEPDLVEVVSTPAACWLLRQEAQQSIGLFSDEYYPMQYEDVDFSIRLGLAGWKIVCDRSVRIKHIENLTTRNLKEHPFARVSVKQALKFRKKWADVLPQIATLTNDEIYWGPIPRVKTQ